MNINEVYGLLETVKNILNVELPTNLDAFPTEFVPQSQTIQTDWITFIKSDSFTDQSFIDYADDFAYFVANANNFLALKNDATAYGLLKTSINGLNLFFSSPCVPLLPVREVTIPSFNLEVISGYVFIISYKPYVAGSSSTLYWELRKRVSGLSLKRVYYDANAGLFNPVNSLILKETLGNWYSGSGAYAYESNGIIRVVDV